MIMCSLMMEEVQATVASMLTPRLLWSGCIDKYKQRRQVVEDLGTHIRDEACSGEQRLLLLLRQRVQHVQPIPEHHAAVKVHNPAAVNLIGRLTADRH